MRSIERLLMQYGESHQNKTNVTIHAIAVPSIYFVTIGLLWSLPVPEMIAQFDITWAHIITVPVLYYYFMFSKGAGLHLLSCGVTGMLLMVINAGMNFKYSQ